MGEKLSAKLRHNEADVLLRNAGEIRQCADETQRNGAAVELIRMVMYRAALGQISDRQRSRILNILRPYCPEVFFTKPNEEQPAALLSADDFRRVALPSVPAEP